MKSLSVFVAACIALAPPTAYAGDAAVSAPIRAMMAGFNKGDVAAVKALHIASPTIVDTVPPFAWTGMTAFDTWLGDLMKAEAALGRSEGAVWFGDPVNEIVAGDRAYVVTPCSYTFKQGGTTMREEGFASFVLVKAGTDWKVESWSWASPAAKPVK